jgi:hypothetical protein
MIDLNAIKAAPEKLIEVARDLWNAERLNPQARICEALAEELIEVVPFIERLQSELTAAHEQLGYNAKPNDSQEWARISGAVAHQLIERHADDWREAGDMMEAFAASRAAARPEVVLSDQKIIELANLELHALNFRWAGDAEEICVFGHAVAAAAQQAPADASHVYNWLHLVETKIGTPAASMAARVLKEFYEGAGEAPADAGQAQALADADQVPYLIVYDDVDQQAEPVIGGTRARYRFKQISGSWNAHLYVKIESNSRDETFPSARIAPPAPAAQPEAKAEPVQHIPANFTTHRMAWRKAIAQSLSASDNAADRAYWQHELDAYDRAFTRLLDKPEAVRRAAPAVTALSDEQIEHIARKHCLDGSMLVGSRMGDYIIPFARYLLAAAGNSQGQAAQPEHGIYWQGEQITTTARLIEIVKEWAAKAWDDGHKAAQPEQQPVVDDLAALVRQLVHSLAKAKPDSPLVERALDYLRRKGLQGSPLRADAAPVPAAAPGPLGGWQPIETAPLEGLIDILMPDGKRWCGVYYDRICDEWRNITPHGKIISVKRNYPTHWMPLPAAPAPKGEQHG